MYKYYQEYNSEEHMLFACEIAYTYNLYPDEYYDESVDIKERLKVKKSTENKIHKKMREYIKDNNIDYIPCYTQTKNGLKKVYPKRIYEEVIKIKNRVEES